MRDSDFMKKKKIFMTLIALGIIIVVIGTIIAITGSNSKNKKPRVEKEIVDLVKSDYKASNIIYGTPETEEKYMFFDNVEYKVIGYKEFKSLTYVYTIIDDTYTGVMNTYFLKDVDKYNKYMAISDIIYVNINSKCDVGKFDNNISTYYDKNNNKIIKSNKREAKVVKVNGKYKLEGSLYNCID